MASRPNIAKEGMTPVSDEDKEYARMLLDWSHSLDHKKTRFEDFRLVWLYEREGSRGLTSPVPGSSSGSA